jgi:hypothetical protein
MYTTSKKITNNDAKNIISSQDVILVDDSSINAYTDSTNYYNAGVYERSVFARLKGVIS